MGPRLGARRRISPPPVQRAVRSARASARPRKYGGSLAAATVVSAGARRGRACWWHVGARRVPAGAAGARENPAYLRGRVLAAQPGDQLVAPRGVAVELRLLSEHQAEVAVGEVAAAIAVDVAHCRRLAAAQPRP